jgi:hypothetical protein
MAFDDRVKGLLDGRSFAVLATLNPDGTHISGFSA